MSLRSGQVKIRKVVKYIQVLLVDKFVSLSTTSDEEVHYAMTITAQHVRHFIKMGTSKWAKDPRVRLLRAIRDAVLHFQKWTDPTTPSGYTYDNIVQRANSRQTLFHQFKHY